MATLGNSGNPSNGYIYDDYGSGEQYWTPFTMPTGGGVVSDLYVYAGGDGSSWSGNLCIWSGSRLLWSSGGITFPSSPRSNGGQQWLHVSVPSVFVPAGTINLGYWAGGNVVWTQDSASGNTYHGSVSGYPADLPSSSINAGYAMGAYIVYTPGGVELRRAGAWGAYTSKRRAGTTWNTTTNKRWKNGAWVSVT